MGLDNCFQLSTISSTRGVAAVHAHHPFSLQNNKINLCKAAGGGGGGLLMNRSSLSFSSSSSSSSSSFAHSFSFNSSNSSSSIRDRKSHIVCKARDAIDEVLVATDSSWNTLVVTSEKPVMVEFWAPWCGPCRMIAPVVDELAKEYAGKILCCKVNTDDCPNIATQYGIRSIPTVLFFKKGEKKESVIGAVPKSTLSAAIDKYLDE